LERVSGVSELPSAGVCWGLELLLVIIVVFDQLQQCDAVTLCDIVAPEHEAEQEIMRPLAAAVHP
jgi:hypothetical protein